MITIHHRGRTWTIVRRDGRWLVIDQDGKEHGPWEGSIIAVRAWVRSR